MTFDRPMLLAAMVPILAALAFAYRFAERRRGAQALAYSNLAFALAALRPARWPGALLFIAYVAGAAALFAALAGPCFFARVPVKDGTVVLCIDTSGSMRARDVSPTRSGAALAAAQTFIAAVPPGTRVGIVAFASTANVIAPPTADLDAVRESLERLPPPNGATAIGDALLLAAAQLPPSGSRIVVVLTDGVNNRGQDPLEASQSVGSRGISIETVGVGSSGSGEIIPGTAELAELDAAALRAIAANGHGRYVEAGDAEALRAAFRGIALRTVWQQKRIDGSLPVAIGGGLLLAFTFIAGLAAGRFP